MMPPLSPHDLYVVCSYDRLDVRWVAHHPGAVDSLAAGGGVYWNRYGEERYVSNETIMEAVRIANEHAAMHEARGVNEFDPVAIYWEDAAKVEPPTP